MITRRIYTGFAKTLLLMVCLLTVSLLPLNAASAAKDSDWQLLKETPDSVIYLHTGDIETTADLTIKVRYKTIAKSRLYREFIQDIRAEDGFPTAGYDKFSYTLSLVEIDCAAMRRRILEGADYDKSGRILGKPLPKEDWKRILPETPFAALAAWVCEEHPLINDMLDDEDGS